MILNGLLRKEQILRLQNLSFLRLHPSTAFQTLFFEYDGYSVSSEGFLLTAVDIMVI